MIYFKFRFCFRNRYLLLIPQRKKTVCCLILKFCHLQAVTGREQQSVFVIEKTNCANVGKNKEARSTRSYKIGQVNNYVLLYCW